MRSPRVSRPGGPVCRTRRTRSCRKALTAAKKTQERAWLAEVSSVVLQQALADANTAYRNFFASITGKRKGSRLGAPGFRSRRDSRQAVRFTRNARFAVTAGGRLRLPKIGDVLVRWSRELPSEPSSVTVVKDAAGRYFASFVVEVDTEPLPPVESEAGIDLGLTTFAVLSNGKVVDSPKFLRRAERKLRTAQQAPVPQGEGQQQPGQGAPACRQGPRRSGQRPQGLRTQAVHDGNPREPSGVCRGLVRDRAGADTVGEVGPRCRVGHVPSHAGGEGRPVRADAGEGRPVLPVEPDVLDLRAGRRAETVVGSGMDVPVRGASRPGPQRSDEHPRRRTPPTPPPASAARNARPSPTPPCRSRGTTRPSRRRMR